MEKELLHILQHSLGLNEYGQGNKYRNPFMFAFNVLQVVVFGAPLFVVTMLRWLAMNNIGLWDMTILRWNEPRVEGLPDAIAKMLKEDS